MDGPSRRMSEVEQSAVESLLSCSENCKEEVFDGAVVTSNWAEVAHGWRNAKPNARYVFSPEKRKKSKEKFQIGQTFSDSETQFAKVKKLAGMIANSNIILKEENSATKLKIARSTALAKYQNCGVLSYDVPCWRFILDPRHFRYIDRLGFLEIRALNDRTKGSTTHSIVLENGGMVTCQELNGKIVLFDPALTFDSHLLATYDLREEYKLRVCSGTNGSFEYSTDFYQDKTDDNRIRIVQAVAQKSNTGTCSSCEMCRHRTQEIIRNPPKIISPEGKGPELKPLQKVTLSQKNVAEQCHAFKTSKSIKDGKDHKKAREGRVYHSRPTVRLDWLPITRSTIAYPFVQSMAPGNDSGSSSSSSNSNVPEHPSSSIIKNYALPRHQTRARKLTLSEAANLVPNSTRIGETFDKLTQKLENNHGKSLRLSAPLLPSVSGTKLQVSLSSLEL